jgi:hypothetical protein
VLSLAVMPTLAFAKQRVGKGMGSRALVADSNETWVCSYLSLTLLLGLARYSAGGGLTRWVRSRCSRSSFGRAGRRWLKRTSQQTTKTDAQPIEGSQPLCLDPGAVRCCGQDQISRSRLRL